MNRSNLSTRFRLLILFCTILVSSTLLIWHIGTAQALAPLADSCFATFDDGVNVESSADASALQTAIDNAPAGATVKVAGTCTGTTGRFVNDGGINQTAYLTQSITVQGGYTTSNWTTPNSDLNKTVLDANSQGRVIVAHNAAGGAAIQIVLSDLTLRNGDTDSAVILRAVDADPVLHSNQGGGVLVASDVNITIRNSTLSDNSADGDGGGIRNYGTLTIDESYLASNTSSASGGGLSNIGTLTITKSTLNNNISSNGGGVYNASGSSAVIVNSTFSDNNGGTGGGVYNSGNMDVEFSTLSENRSSHGGSGLFSNATTTIKGSILANSQNQDDCRGVAAANISYSLIEDGSCDAANGDNNLTGDPNLGPLQDSGGATGTYALLRTPAASPAIDHWAEGDCPSTDQRGTARDDDACDLGAYELNKRACAATYGGDAEAFFSADASAVQQAIDAANAGDTIKIAGMCLGVTAKAVSGGTISQTAYISKSLILQGGYASSNWAAAPNQTLNPTILDADGKGRVVVLHDVQDSDQTVVIEHLTIQNGNANDANGGFEPFVKRGGGIFVDDRYTVEIRNSIVQGSSAEDGGGLYNFESTTIKDSEIANNYASIRGGGIINPPNSELTIEDSTIAHNSSGDLSGGIRNLSSGTVMVRNSTIAHNSADDHGGITNAGMLTIEASSIYSNSARFSAGINNNGTLFVTNSTLAGNSAEFNGNAIHTSGGNTTILNSTLYRNQTSNNTEGLTIFSGGTVTLTNSIIAGSTNADCFVGGDSTLIATHSLIEDGSCGITNGVDGNKTGDPMLDLFDFYGGATQTYPLKIGSPAIDSADDNACPFSDQRGFLRYDGACDMGAFEHDSQGACAARTAMQDFFSIDAGAINNALDAAGDGGLIKVAGACVGTESFGSGSNAMTQTLTINQSVTIEGGHTPENWDADPDSEAYPTILDAEKKGRVIVLEQSLTERSTMNVTLNNLTVRNGYGHPDQFGTGYGGGVLVGEGVNVTINQSTFVDNSAETGGGALSNDGSATINNSTFNDNTSTFFGGALTNEGTMTINDSEIERNQSYIGGGITNFTDAQLTVNGGTLWNNKAKTVGGAIYSIGYTTIQTGSIAYNEAERGGGIDSRKTLTVTTSIIAINTATQDGGGIFSSGSATIDKSAIFNNQADQGAGVHNEGEELLIVNSTVSNNSAETNGSAIYTVGGSTTLINSTVSENSRYVNAHGVETVSGGSLALSNSIIEFTFNAGADCSVSNDSTITINHSLIHDATCGIVEGVDGNLTGAPGIGGLVWNGGPTPTHKPTSSNRISNMGDPAVCSSAPVNGVDQRGVERFLTCDMGSYQTPPKQVFVPIVIK